MTPNPVSWSDAPVSGCGSDRPNHWFWDQILKNTGGTRITLTERVNYQDGTLFSRSGDSITIEPGASFTRATSVCLATNTDHTFRTDWTGSDTAGNRIAATGPNVTLKKK